MLVLNILKTLLEHTFGKIMYSPDLSLCLSHNQKSTNNEEAKKLQEKALVLEEKETTTKLYGPIIRSKERGHRRENT